MQGGSKKGEGVNDRSVLLSCGVFEYAICILFNCVLAFGMGIRIGYDRGNITTFFSLVLVYLFGFPCILWSVVCCTTADAGRNLTLHLKTAIRR